MPQSGFGTQKITRFDQLIVVRISTQDGIEGTRKTRFVCRTAQQQRLHKRVFLIDCANARRSKPIVTRSSLESVSAPNVAGIGAIRAQSWLLKDTVVSPRTPLIVRFEASNVEPMVVAVIRVDRRTVRIHSRQGQTV